MQDKIIVESGKKWEFDNEVASVFDNMLERSIPQYDIMRELCYRIGNRYIKDDTYIMDVGCSLGNAILPFIKSRKEKNKYVLLDVSEPMIAKAKERFEPLRYECNIDIQKNDIIKELPIVECSLILSILTIQFTPIEYRQKIMKRIYDRLIEGGALIFVEKVLGNDYRTNNDFVEEYYKIKKEHQYTQEQIEAKRKSLEGVLVPITSKWNEELLLNVGFKTVDCFWKFLNFQGWVCIK